MSDAQRPGRSGCKGRVTPEKSGVWTAYGGEISFDFVSAGPAKFRWGPREQEKSPEPDWLGASVRLVATAGLSTHRPRMDEPFAEGGTLACLAVHGLVEVAHGPGYPCEERDSFEAVYFVVVVHRRAMKHTVAIEVLR